MTAASAPAAPNRRVVSQHTASHRPRKRSGGPTYTVELRPKPGVDSIRELRAALQCLLRRHGLRCLSVHEAAR